MTGKFIDLNRSFMLIPNEHEYDEEENDYLFALGYKETEKWEDLLKMHRVVILAEAGAGKTEEVKFVTKKLRNDNKFAFFFRLEHLGSDFETSFDIGNIEEFNKWLNSDKKGWFFLDSVDEAKLRDPYQFDAAIRKLAIKLGQSKQRTHIYITSRLSEWKPKSDFALVKERLPFIDEEVSDDQEDDGVFGVFGDVSSSSSVSINKSNKELIEPSVYALQSLDSDQIRVFSKINNVNNLEEFICSIEKNEADIFASRPQDLIELIEYWQEYRVVSNRKKLIENSISIKLKETDSNRDGALPLSLDEAYQGAESLAAAVTLTRQNRILVMDSNSSQATVSEAINVKNVLSDWDVNKVRALLQRPIFDEAIYGAVRFHHRSVREFLTARWVHGLLLKDKSRRNIENIFFSDRYGRKVLIPSMRPVLSWLILFDQKILEKAVGIAPEICLQNGDPSELPTELRKEMLEKFCKYYADKNLNSTSIDFNDVRRFSHADLGGCINNLLDLYANNQHIMELLLRIIWQGEIQECSDKVINCAVNTKNKVYTRIYAIRSIGAIGTESQKSDFIKELMKDFGSQNESLIGEIIAVFSPVYLSVKDVLGLIENIHRTDTYIDWPLNQALKVYSQDSCPEEGLVEWVIGCCDLLKTEPVYEAGYYDISKKYRWLLSYAVYAIERLIKNRHAEALCEDVLYIITLLQDATIYGDEIKHKNSFAELIPEWNDLNHSLFWFDVNRSRKRLDKIRGERLTQWYQAESYSRFWQFSGNDFLQILEDVKNKTEMDDKLVALSLSFRIYVENGRGQTRRCALKKAVKGKAELEAVLHGYLNPPPLSDSQKNTKRYYTNQKRRQKRAKEREIKNRKKWREWLKNNTHVLMDTSVAKDGSVWNATNYLMRELRKIKDGSNRWANSHWEELIPEFGIEVAEAYRDGCIAYWRKYSPTIISDGQNNANSIPNAVVVGLSGLEIEAAYNKDWPKNLSEDEAVLASRYALKELNGFPEWLQKLHLVFPRIVESTILNEIEWEFSEYQSAESPCRYVLSDVVWQLDWIKPFICNQLINYLNQYEHSHLDTVKNAIDIVLSTSKFDKSEMLNIAQEKYNIIDHKEKKVLWLIVITSLDARKGVKNLDEILSSITDRDDTIKLAMNYIVNLLGSNRKRSKNIYNDYLKVEHLTSLIKLMHFYIKVSEDIDRVNGKVYSPGLRDDAQGARDNLLNLLKEIPGKEAYLAILNLAENLPDKSTRDWCRECAKRRAETDSEFEKWMSEDIKYFSDDAEIIPKNNRGLFDLTVSRLLDFKLELEDGDTSLAEVLQTVTDEKKHRNYIAGWLRDNSSSKYSIAQEDELADASRPDIRVLGCGIDVIVPIELKIADNWSGNSIAERLRNQLSGQYLRDIRSNCGIFLLVYRGDKKGWENPQTADLMNFSELLECLRSEADAILAEDNKIAAIEVIGINLNKRSSG